MVALASAETLRMADRPPATVLGVGAVAAFTLFVIAAVAGVRMALGFGPWIDEFASLWESDPSASWREALTARWAFDVHPPAYMIALRLVRSLWPGADIPALRLLNLLPLALLAAYAASAWMRRPERRSFIAATVAILVGGELFGAAMADLRPYSPLVCASAVAALAGAIAYADRAKGRDASHVELGAGGIALFALANGHFLAAFAGGLWVSALALGLGWRGARGAALRLLATFAVLALPALAFLLWRMGYMAGWTGGGFWIRTTPAEALAIEGWFLPRVTGFNLLAWAAFALALVPALRRWNDPMDDIPLLAGLAKAAALTLLFVLNLHTPIVLERYLLFLGGPLAAGLGAATARWARLRPWLYAATLAVSVIAGMRAARAHTAFTPQGWTGTAALVAANVRRCPGSRVDLFHWSDPSFNPLPTDAAVHDYGYAYLARRYGFVAAVERPLAQTDPACPRLLWGEHLGPALGLATPQVVMLKLLTGRSPIPPAFIRPDIEMERGESGYVIKAPSTARPR